MLLIACAIGASTVHAQNVRFAVFGDYGDDNANEQAVANLVGAHNVDFIVTTGDNSYGDTDIDDNIGQYYSDYIGSYNGGYGNGSLSGNRFFPSLGNHDWSDGGGINAYLNYFTLPGAGIPSTNTSGNERYYDFIQGPVHFFVVDSDGDEPDGNSRTSVQAQWLQAQLAASTAPWKLVFMHHPPYSSSTAHGNSDWMQWPFEDWGATAVLAGHDHTYERIHKDGNNDGVVFPYFVSGAGGRSLYNFPSSGFEPGSMARYDDNYGTMVVEADNGSITFAFYSISGGGTGTLIDTYTIAGSEPAPDIAVDPASHDYGGVTVGSGASRTFTVTNQGTVDLVVSAPTLGGPDAGAFSIVAGGAAFTLAPGASHDVVVDFNPAAGGVHNATLSLASNDPDEATLNVSLVGAGLEESANVCTAFALLAEEEVKVEKQDDSEGAVFSNNKIEFKQGDRSRHSGDLTAVGDVTIDEDQTIHGDVTAGGNVDLDGKATVNGSVTEGAAVTPVPLPGLSFSAGGNDVKVNKNRTRALPPGSYDDVKLEDGATLLLNAGEYFFKKLELQNEAVVSADVSGGPVTVNVVQDIKMDDRAVLEAPGASNTTSFSVNTLEKLESRKQGRLTNVTVVAPNDLVKVEEGVVNGSICARKVEIKKGTFSSGVAAAPITSVGVVEAAPAAMLPAFALEQNYPNPFNPATRIRFQVPEAGHVRMAVYDVAGREVARLVDAPLGAGIHEVTFNASTLPSGVYFYRLTAGSFAETRRMVLMK